jgi:hypothetical protein
MTASRSRQQVVLDCCYSGAFPAGRVAKAGTEMHVLENFQGRGRTVLTASDSSQYAFEGDQVVGEASRSVFTRWLVAGLRDGSADLDGDGDITLDELYSYVYDRVVEELPRQRPKKQDNVEGRLVIARNISWSLPQYISTALASPIAADRRTALDNLLRLHETGNEIVRRQVREQIEHLVEDDSKAVSTAASNWLETAPPSRSDPSPAPTPGDSPRKESGAASRPVSTAPEQPKAQPEMSVALTTPPALPPASSRTEEMPITESPRPPDRAAEPAQPNQTVQPDREAGSGAGDGNHRSWTNRNSYRLALIRGLFLILAGSSVALVATSTVNYYLPEEAIEWAVAVALLALGIGNVLPRTHWRVGVGLLLGMLPVASLVIDRAWFRADDDPAWTMQMMAATALALGASTTLAILRTFKPWEFAGGVVAPAAWALVGIPVSSSSTDQYLLHYTDPLVLVSFLILGVAASVTTGWFRFALLTGWTVGATCIFVYALTEVVTGSWYRQWLETGAAVVLLGVATALAYRKTRSPESDPDQRRMPAT